jgi:hypothetical protein
MRRALALSIPLLLLSAACTYDNGDVRHLVIDPAGSTDVACSTEAQSTIDTNRTIDNIDAGQGAGVYIEYAAGGHWHVRTSCDSDKQNIGCNWDVLVYPAVGHALSNFVPEDLEADDTLAPYPNSQDTFELNAHTTTDIDGFTFDGDPGVATTVDAFLDGTCALPYFFWVGDDALHPGSPSNPLTLTPSSD